VDLFISIFFQEMGDNGEDIQGTPKVDLNITRSNGNNMEENDSDSESELDTDSENDSESELESELESDSGSDMDTDEDESESDIEPYINPLIYTFRNNSKKMIEIHNSLKKQMIDYLDEIQDSSDMKQELMSLSDPPISELDEDDSIIDANIITSIYYKFFTNHEKIRDIAEAFLSLSYPDYKTILYDNIHVLSTLYDTENKILHMTYDCDDDVPPSEAMIPVFPRPEIDIEPFEIDPEDLARRLLNLQRPE